MTSGSRSTALAVTLLIAMAAITRLTGLGEAPLDSRESSQSVAAWWTVTGDGEELSRLDPRPGSALLLGLDVLVFSLVGSLGDVFPRLVPALAGAAVGLLPFLLRPAGWAATLPLALLLTVDPWMIAQSRRGDGAILAAGAAIACYLLLRRATAVESPAAAPAARPVWTAAAVAAGLLAVSGASTWDFAAPVAAAAALFGSRRRGAMPGRERPPSVALLGVAAAVALVAATTGLLQWQGPALVSNGFESWLASFGGAPRPVAVDLENETGVPWATVAYVTTLAVLAAWGLVRAWRTPARPDATTTTSFAGRVEAETLGLWLLWGAALQLRPGREAESWLALQVPLLIAAALPLEELATRLAWRRSAGAWRLAAVAAMALVLVAGAAGVESAPASRGDTLPPVRRLARDVAVLEERPAADKPRLVVAGSPRIDGRLAWYLRSFDVSWVEADTSEADDGDPKLVLVTRPQPAGEADPPLPAYAIGGDSGARLLVELRESR